MKNPRNIRRALALFALAAAALGALPAAAANYLWEVTSLTNRAYLFGTVHAGKQDWYPLPPEDEVIQMKPFMAVSLLVFSEWARLGFLPSYGVDAYLLTKAKEQKKTIVEIEGVDTQIKLMD